MLPILAVLGLLNSGVKRAETHIKDFIVAFILILVISLLVGNFVGGASEINIGASLIDGVIAYIVGLIVGYAREKITA